MYPRINVRVGEDMLQQLREAAEEQHCTVGALVRTAIRFYLIEVYELYRKKN